MKQAPMVAAVSAIALMTGGHVFAQEIDEPADSGDEVRELDQVTVTAVKREQDLNDVPVSVTAFTSDLREELALDDLSDLSRFTPSLAFSAGDDRVFIRGVGRQTNTNGSDPGVATYSDGIYDASTAAISKSDFFIERVEVLRGPQGTLYGRNSIGGAINVISKRPTDEFTAEARVTIGNYSLAEVNASVSGPVAKGVNLKLAGSYFNQADGYFENAAGGPSEAGAEEVGYLEFQMDAEVTENFSLWLKADTAGGNYRNRTTIYGGPYDTAPFPNGYLTPGPAFGFLTPGYNSKSSETSNPAIDDIRTFDVNTPTSSKINDNYGISTLATWNLDTIDIKYLGGYRTYYYDSYRDDDNTSMISYTYPLDPANANAGEVLTGGPNCQWLLENVGPVCAPATIYPSRTFGYVEDKEYWSHEVNIQASGDPDFWWIVGAYAYEENFSQQSHFGNAAQPQMKTPLAAPENPSGDYVTALSDLNTKSYALFGQVDYALTDELTVTGGLRYSMDEKEGSESVRVLGYGIVPGFTLGGSGIFAPVLDLTASSISYQQAAGVDSEVTIDPDTGLAHRRLKNSWNALSGAAGIQWQPDIRSNYFFRYARGYKSGGFNAGGISQFPQTDEELIDSYELGLKKTLGDSLQVNATAYYYSYDGLQIPLDVQENGLRLTRFFNLEESTAQGIELEANWSPTDRLRFLFSYAYNDSEIQDACCFVDVADPYATQPGAQPVGQPDASGNQYQSLEGEMLPRTIPSKFGLNASYTFPLADSGDLTLSANYSWQDATYHGVFNRAYNETPSYEQVDLIALFRSVEDAYSIIGHVKNVFDEQGYDGSNGTFLYQPFGSVAQTYYMTAPRTYGVQIQMRF
ncbi:MAG: TonB-dependent receptor [Alphaproteobacteria bacterium]|nr:TonB-dependent receptor [Alphaproteobacteria bacterium]